MGRRLIATFVLAAATLPLTLTSCSSTSFSFSKQSDNGLNNVDELLTRVEKVQVESLVAKERVREAYKTLTDTVRPQFKGDAVKQHELLTKSIKESQKQSKALAATIPALKSAAGVVFERWTKDLDGFSNARMRQRSQERMEATREQYETLLRQTLSAQLALDAFNSELNDHALFLGHDFNAESAGLIRDDVAALESRAVELDGRLDAAIGSSKTYIASRALRGEVGGAAKDADPTAGTATAKGPRKRARQQQDAESEESGNAPRAVAGAQPYRSH